MVSIVDVVLFYSKFSKECVPCIRYIENNKLPVTLLPLDDQESRNRAFNGSHIQITKVPTLLVCYSNNDVQQYLGNQKIIAWFSAMTNPSPNHSNPSNPPNHSNPSNPPHSHNKHEIIPDSNVKLHTPVKKKKTGKKGRSKTPKHIIHQSDPSHHTELIFDEETPTSTHLPTHLSSKLSTSSPKPSPNEGIMAMAKQMAAERDRQLNYKNEGGQS